jgi:Hydroxymethylglutaryl-coenzyme A synthase C terminal
MPSSLSPCSCFEEVRTALPQITELEDERARERALLRACTTAWDRCGADGVLFSRELGNLYTGSLLSGLLAQVMALMQRGEKRTQPTRLIGFAYGSGYASSLISCRWCTRCCIVGVRTWVDACLRTCVLPPRNTCLSRYIYIYIYICDCVCVYARRYRSVCVCVCVRSQI